MKLNLNFQIKQLNGEDGKGDGWNAGKLLAGQLISGTKGDSIKLTDWARKLWAGEEIEIDNSDKMTLEKFVEADNSLINLAKSEILKKLHELK